MWEDPDESPALRQLLRAGRVEHCEYDVEKGLARHLAQLQSAAPTPGWAAQTVAVQKTAGWSLLPWLLPPMVSAVVVGTWLSLRPAEPSVPLVATSPLAAAGIAVEQAGISPGSTTAGAQEAVFEASPRSELARLGQAASKEQPASDARERHDSRPIASAMGRSSRGSIRAGVGSRRARAVPLTSTGASEVDSSGGAPGGLPKADVTEASSSASSRPVARADSLGAAADERSRADEREAQEPSRPARDPKAQENGRRPAVDENTGARLEREMRMLAVAQRVLTEDPARSLRLSRQGESEFPSSMFSAERKQLALLALVQLGRVDEARREGIPFLRAYPNAPWSARLREALASGHLPTR
jgi:hypothetical protein